MFRFEGSAAKGGLELHIPHILCVCAACLEILELLFGAHTLTRTHTHTHSHSHPGGPLLWGAILLFVCWHAVLVSASVSMLQKLSEYLSTQPAVCQPHPEPRSQTPERKINKKSWEFETIQAWRGSI